MLLDLRIQNYALIEQLELRPSPLLNIITGETGAGKSIMLGAIGLLLGNRADSKMLFNTERKCVIEGQFDIKNYQLQDIFESEDLDYESQCILRREISPSGKSRAFVNDTPVTLEALRKIGANLMDIHSQHDTLLLGDAVFQLNLLDLYGGLVPARTHYGNAYRQYRKLDGKQEAQLIALACSKTPDGQARWTMKLLADKLVEMAVVASIDPATVWRTLQKTTSSRGSSSTGSSRRRPMPRS